MSKSVAWLIPTELIEYAICSKAQLSGPVSVYGAGFDEVGEQVFVIIDVEEEDLDRLLADDVGAYELDEGELVQ